MPETESAEKPRVLSSQDELGRNTPVCHGATHAGRAALVILCGLLTVCLMLHHRAANGGSYNQIMEALALEHWHEAAYHHSLAGIVSISGNQPLTYGSIYSFFRVLELEPHRSTACASVVVRTAGFCGFYLAARRLLDLKPGWAVLATVAFTLGGSAFMQASHAQLMSLAFAPVMAVLLQGLAEALRATRRAQAIAYGAPMTCLYAAWLLTAAYTACVFLLLLGFVALAYLVATRHAGLRAAFEFARRSGDAQTSRYPIS